MAGYLSLLTVAIISCTMEMCRPNIQENGEEWTKAGPLALTFRPAEHPFKTGNPMFFDAVINNKSNDDEPFECMNSYIKLTDPNGRSCIRADFSTAQTTGIFLEESVDGKIREAVNKAFEDGDLDDIVFGSDSIWAVEVSVGIDNEGKVIHSGEYVFIRNVFDLNKLFDVLMPGRYKLEYTTRGNTCSRLFDVDEGDDVFGDLVIGALKNDIPENWVSRRERAFPGSGVEFLETGKKGGGCIHVIVADRRYGRNRMERMAGNNWRIQYITEIHGKHLYAVSKLDSIKSWPGFVELLRKKTE